MKKNTIRQYAQSLYQITRNAAPKQLPEITKQFLFLLTRHHQLNKIDFIIKEFDQYAKEQEGIQEITIESASTINSENLQNIKKIFGGENTIVHSTIKQNIIGGMRLISKNLIFDATLKKQLQKLKEHLSR